MSAKTLQARPQCERANCDLLSAHVHHRCRSRLGAELPDDLRALCNQCHKDLETFYKSPKVARSMEDATDLFLQGFPFSSINLPIVAFFTTGIDRGNLWYARGRSFAGSVLPDLFQQTKKRFPPLSVCDKEKWRSPSRPHFSVSHPYGVHIFGVDRDHGGMLRYVDEFGVTGGIQPDKVTKLLTGTSHLPSVSRDEGKVIGPIIHGRMNSNLQLVLF